MHHITSQCSYQSIFGITCLYMILVFYLARSIAMLLFSNCYTIQQFVICVNEQGASLFPQQGVLLRCFVFRLRN